MKALCVVIQLKYVETQFLQIFVVILDVGFEWLLFVLVGLGLLV